MTNEQIEILRETYIDVMINRSTRWVTIEDSETLDSGEFKGFMMESIWSEVVIPMLEAAAKQDAAEQRSESEEHF